MKCFEFGLQGLQGTAQVRLTHLTEVIVVDDNAKVGQLEMTCKHQSLPVGPFVQFPITEDDKYAACKLLRPQAYAYADADRKTVSQRSRRMLDPRNEMTDMTSKQGTI